MKKIKLEDRTIFELEEEENLSQSEDLNVDEDPIDFLPSPKIELTVENCDTNDNDNGVLPEVKLEMDGESESTPSERFPCPECSKTYKTKATRRQHIRSVHYIKSEAEDHILPTENNHPFSCSKCRETFFTERKLKSHLIRVHPVPTHKCSTCRKEFKSEENLRQHEILHTDPTNWQFKCDVCGKPFFKKNDLQVHLEDHWRMLLFKCKTCGKRFGRRSDLEAHYLEIHKDGQEAVGVVPTTISFVKD